MAVIECDWHNREHPADVMVSQLKNGETFAACQDGFLAFCIGMVENAAEAEATETAEEANRKLDQLAGEAGFPSSPESSGEAAPVRGRRSRPVDEPDESEAIDLDK